MEQLKIQANQDILLNERQVKQLFLVSKANVARSRIAITAIFISVYDVHIFPKENQQEIESLLEAFLNSKIRQTDILYKLANPYQWGIILSQSGEREADAFLKRVYKDLETMDFSLFTDMEVALSSSVIEIVNSDITFETLLGEGQGALAKALEHGPWETEYVATYKEKGIENIKISILETDEIFANVLHASASRSTPEQFEAEIRQFQDGYEFLESNWFLSSHTHILVINDILPRKNGLEILKYIRSLPNNRRFIILMMTKRKSEEDMIYAFENGVDDYLVKPFNLRLFEAQLKRIFKGLWA